MLAGVNSLDLSASCLPWQLLSPGLRFQKGIRICKGPDHFPNLWGEFCSSFLWRNHNLEMLAPCVEFWKMEPTFALRELMISVDGSDIWRLDHVDGESPIFFLDLLLKCWENAKSIPQMVFWVMFYHGRSLQTTFNKSRFARVSYVSTVQPDFSPSMWITPRLGTSFAALKAFPLLEPRKRTKTSWTFHETFLVV